MYLRLFICGNNPPITINFKTMETGHTYMFIIRYKGTTQESHDEFKKTSREKDEYHTPSLVIKEYITKFKATYVDTVNDTIHLIKYELIESGSTVKRTEEPHTIVCFPTSWITEYELLPSIPYDHDVDKIINRGK